jgi:hypothetical protein
MFYSSSSFLPFLFSSTLSDTPYRLPPATPSAPVAMPAACLRCPIDKMIPTIEQEDDHFNPPLFFSLICYLLP